MSTNGLKVDFRYEEKVTIVYGSGLGFSHVAIEAKLLDVYAEKWAQYDHAIHIEFRRKGARNAWRMTQTNRPHAVILRGWNLGIHIPDTFGARRSDGSGVSCSTSRHASCSPEWDREAREAIEASGAEVILDLHGWNAYRGAFENGERES